MCKQAGRSANISDTVLCADIGYPTTETTRIVGDEIRPFSIGTPKKVDCQITGVDVQCDKSNSERMAGSVEMVEKALHGVLQSKRSEEMLGGIYKLDWEREILPTTISQQILEWIGKLPYLGKPIQTLEPLKGESAFVFTMPLKVERPSGIEKVTFLLCTVDFAYPTLLLILSVIGGTVCIAGLFVSIFYSFQARRKSFEFIGSLEEVMKASPVSFLHLSEEGRIVNANKAFQELMGNSLEELKQQTFFSLMDQPSQARYSIIAECRRHKLLTPPYEITLVKKSGEPKSVVVCGSALDMPRTSEFKISEPAATFLHTFGIIVPRTDMSDQDCDNVGVLKKDLGLNEFRVLVTRSAHSM